MKLQVEIAMEDRRLHRSGFHHFFAHPYARPCEGLYRQPIGPMCLTGMPSRESIVQVQKTPTPYTIEDILRRPDTVTCPAQGCHHEQNTFPVPNQRHINRFFPQPPFYYHTELWHPALFQDRFTGI